LSVTPLKPNCTKTLKRSSLFHDEGNKFNVADLQFVETVRLHRQGSICPTIVHCSAGIGRTGVLILMETALYLIEANQPVYPLELTRIMRDQVSMLKTFIFSLADGKATDIYSFFL
jgi:protein tyrosine phosphatase